MMSSANASAHDIEVDGVYYKLNESDKTACVTYKGYQYDSYSNEYSGMVIIPTTITKGSTAYQVTNVDSYSFYECNDLTAIYFSNGLTGIGEYAFYKCSNLTNLTLPESLKGIGRCAFNECRNLKALTIPNNVTSIGEGAFQSCEKLSYLKLSNNLSYWGTGVFNNCKSLTSLDIPEGIPYIAQQSFYGCSGLTSLRIPASIKSIEHEAFVGCTNLQTIVVDEGNPKFDSRENCNAIIYNNGIILGCKSTIIPNSVTSIGSKAFYQCKDITTLTLPKTLTYIGDYAFSGCSNLNNLTLPENLKYIGNNAFAGCETITTLTIPNGITEIEDGTFAGCTNLHNIKIPNNVIVIGEAAFRGCSNLQTINIPNELTYIKDEAFDGCHNIQSITLPSKLRHIGELAFSSCLKLTSIFSYIPSETIFEIEYNVFANCSSNPTLYVPYGTKSTYQNTLGWQDFRNIVEMPTTKFSLYVSGANYASLYLDKAVKIPKGVKVYTANEIDGDRVMLQEVTGFLPAYTGVIVKAEAGNYEFKYTDEIVPAIEKNLFKGTTTDTEITPDKNMATYVLSSVNGEVGMYRAKLTDGKFLNNANKVYMELPEMSMNDEELDTSAPGAQLSNGLEIIFPETTDIKEAYIINPQSAIYYDLQGRRVPHPTQGLYILNGKKVYIK